MQQPVFSIIIPVYNNVELTLGCLRSIQQHKGSVPFEIIVVDNASQDSTPVEVPAVGKELFGSGFTFIHNQENRNFSGACNQGAKAAQAAILFFLNNDTLVTQGFAEPLLETLETGVGAVGPLLLFPNDLVQHLGVAVYPDRSIEHFYNAIPGTHPLAQRRRKLRLITAAAIMLRKSDFFFSGRFCEEYINGFEDMELCYRLHQRGLEFTVDPRSRVYHLERASRGKASDNENFKTLLQRCPGIGQPGFHTIAASDGYSVFLSLFFETYLCPESRRLAELAKESAACSVQRHLELIQREIFWEEGYKTLASRMVLLGDHTTAASLMAACCQFFPSLENLREVIPLLRKDGKEQAATAFATQLTFKEQVLTQPNRFSLSYKDLWQTAHTMQDPLLVRLTDEWLEKYQAVFPSLTPVQ